MYNQTKSWLQVCYILMELFLSKSNISFTHIFLCKYELRHRRKWLNANKKQNSENCKRIHIYRQTDCLAFFLYETNPPGPLINRLKWFCWKICFRGDIREISDSAQANTARSQKINFVKISCDTLPLTHMYFFFSEGYYFMQRKLS